jgi:hypothetical protein
MGLAALIKMGLFLKKEEFYKDSPYNVYRSPLLAILPEPIDYYMFRFFMFISGSVSCVGGSILLL